MGGIMTAFATFAMLASMTTQEAIVTLLNSPTSCSPSKFAEAREQVFRDAQDGHPLQQFLICVTTDDKELADRLYESSHDKLLNIAKQTDNPLAWYLLSMRENNLALLEKAAKGGNVQALNALGMVLVNSIETSLTVTDKAKRRASRRAFDCFNKAAMQGDANGFVNLGTCYLQGFGCDYNLKLAHECFLTAAKAGHPEAMEYVAADYNLGNGVEKDAGLCLYWQMKSKAAKGDQKAEKWVKSQSTWN